MSIPDRRDIRIAELEAENERLRDLLKKAAAELREYIHYKNDMDIVHEIEDAIDAGKDSDDIRVSGVPYTVKKSDLKNGRD